jgi:pseudouridine synthase
MKRLNKYLADCGVASRRKADELIRQGRVTVDGRIVQSLGNQIDETSVEVTVDGKSVSLKAKLVYILLNKPKGYVTTANDELARKTVLDLIPIENRVFPVGRLDKDTTGALLLTNDGELAYRLTHPKYDVKKVYQVWLKKSVSAAHVDKLQKGIQFEEGTTRPCQVEIISQDNSQITMTLQEGRNREIRRMLGVFNYDIKKLKRIQFAGLDLKRLAPGKWRYLTEKEIKKLRDLVRREA